jgi:glucose-1-phosphatase
MIRTVIFDLGGVVVPLDFPHAYSVIGERCGLSGSEAKERILGTGLAIELELGRVEPDEFARVVTEALETDIPYEEFIELWGNLFPPHTLIGEDLLAAIKQQCRLLLLSNTNAVHFPYIVRNFPLLNQFDHFILSYELGVMKPDRGIYEAAVGRSHCAAEECFFTDDVQSNVDGARAAGLQSERFEGPEKLREDLIARGLTL